MNDMFYGCEDNYKIPTSLSTSIDIGACDYAEWLNTGKPTFTEGVQPDLFSCITVEDLANSVGFLSICH